MTGVAVPGPDERGPAGATLGFSASRSQASVADGDTAIAIAPANAPTVLSVSGLTVSYATAGGDVAAVNDVSLQLRRGELLAVIGESGSGKSTLARAMLRLLPRTGRVVGGRVVLAPGAEEHRVDLLALRPAALREIRGQMIGFVPQAAAGALDPVHRLLREFEVTLRAHGLSWRRGGRERAEQSLRSAGIPDPAFVLHAFPHELSGGLAQRAVVALATLLQPAVLVADEPTSALDVTVQRLLLDNLAADIRQNRRGSIVITHDIGIARAYCDRVLVMYGGFAVETGPTTEVLSSPRHPYTRALIAAASRRDGATERGPSAGPPIGLPLLASSHGRCPYFDRCRRRSDPRCGEELPPLREVAPGHLVRSFYD